MRSLPRPDLEPQPIAYRDFLELVPEKFEWMEGWAPTQEYISFTGIGAEGRYETALVGREGVYHSEALPDFWLRVEWLWQEPPLKTLDVLRELGVL